jgi:hypothetical protein
MKKRILLITLLILFVVSAILILSETKGTFTDKDKDFAIHDTAMVTKIFLADMEGNTVLLERADSSSWTVNGKHNAQRGVMQEFLRTLMYIAVRSPVATAARDNVLKFMASNGTKVEIYQKKFLVDFLGIRLFQRERLVKTYYVGDNTMDNVGTYMKMEDSETPFITYIPGFSGFLHTRYSTNEYDWRDHTIFNFFMKDIASVTLEYLQEPEKSFKIENPDNRNFKLYSISQKKHIAGFDTIRMINYLSGFYDARFENFVIDPTKSIRDSLMKITPYQHLTVVPKTGDPVEIKTFLKPNQLTPEELEARYFDTSDYPWDRERMWALVYEGNELVTIQYFVFGRILKPIFFFFPEYQEKTLDGINIYEL